MFQDFGCRARMGPNGNLSRTPHKDMPARVAILDPKSPQESLA